MCEMIQLCSHLGKQLAEVWGQLRHDAKSINTFFSPSIHIYHLVSQAVEECDPYCGLLNDIEEDSSDNHVGEEDILGCPNNRDSYWSEEDQELIIPCLALARASKACLKKIRLSVAENGKKDQVAQLDDIVDISDEISPR